MIGSTRRRMTTLSGSVLTGSVLGFLLTSAAVAEQTPGAETPSAEEAGPVDSARQIPSLGSIRLERERRRFTVTGRFIDRDQTGGPQLLEYLAVKTGGHKAYEALLELNSTATEFNLACILIGLDASRAVLPEFHFDPKPVTGDPVDIQVEWDEGSAVRRVPASALLVVDSEPVADNAWVYTGSVLLAPNQYLAEQAGTLIGFVHDRDSVIEHRIGVGLGSGSLVTMNRGLLPPPGTPIRVVVQSITSQE